MLSKSAAKRAKRRAILQNQERSQERALKLGGYIVLGVPLPDKQSAYMSNRANVHSTSKSEHMHLDGLKVAEIRMQAIRQTVNRARKAREGSKAKLMPSLPPIPSKPSHAPKEHIAEKRPRRDTRQAPAWLKERTLMGVSKPREDFISNPISQEKVRELSETRLAALAQEIERAKAKR